MHQGDTTNSYYQFYQPNIHPPNPNPIPVDPVSPHSAWPPATVFASAPPVSAPNYAPAAPDQPSSYMSNYSPYPQNPAPVPVPNPSPTAPSTYNYPYDQNQPPYYQYDQNQTAASYAPPNPNPNPNSTYPGAQLSPAYGHLGASGAPPNFENSYDPSVKFDQFGAGYADDSRSRYTEPYNGYGSSFENRDTGFSEEGAYRYEGKVEPYGARGTAGGPRSSSSSSSSQVLFDDYGRPINLSKGEDRPAQRVSTKVVRAIPKADNEEDVKSGAQKFRVKLLSEGYGQSDLDVLCQVGLDGIRMLEPSSGRTLRIYSLDGVTKWEVLDSNIFAFWARTSVDIEPKRIRLKSNSYTSNAILDTVTAHSFQLKEMGDRKDSETVKTFEQQQAEKKKGLADWMNFIKPPNEEKDHWVPDEAVNKCTSCGTNFNAFVRRHHCRNCGEIFCDKCTQGRTPLNADEDAQPVRVCDRCMAEVTQRLAYANSSRAGAGKSHEDLAKKLKEEMSKNAKGSTGSRSEGSRGMREVACPTCTVHLQVQVPASGSETIECSVCQHPFLVGAH